MGIRSDAGRILRALVSALAALGACTGEPGRAGESAWDFQVDSTPAAGTGPRRTVWLRTVGKEGPHGEPQTNEVLLSFDCQAAEAGTRILTRQALRQGSVEVQLTVDAEPPRTIPGFAGTTPSGGQVVFTIPVDSALALLAHHQRASFDYADGAGSSRTTAVFTVAGLDGRRQSFLAACPRD